MDLPNTVLVCTWLLFLLSGADHEGCRSPQYLEIGKEGLVNCSFQEHFFGVFWYDSTDTLSNKPILKFMNSAKSGDGYMSGEFDIRPNGSLIINNVSLVHSHVFTVAKFGSQSDDPVRFAVSIISSVIPALRRPVINGCGHKRECYLQVSEAFKVSCSIEKSRPAIPVRWVERTVLGERNASSEMNLTQVGMTFTSSAITTELFNSSPKLIHLVCKAYAPPGMLQEMQASVLIELNTASRVSSQPVTKYFIRGSRVTLPCSDDDTVALVWKKGTSADEHYDTILYSLFDEKHFTKGYSQQYELGDSGSLVIPEVNIQDEGLYHCVYSNGIAGGIKQHEMLIKVDPVIPYPVVDGCNRKQHCVFEVRQEGNLTCSVTGIRPQVQLEWKALDQRTTQLISFVKEKLTAQNNGDTFSVLLITQYRITSRLPTRFTLECTASGSNLYLFPGTTKVDMIYAGDTKDPAEQSPLVLVGFILAVGLLLCLTGGVMTYRAWRKSKRNASHANNQEEEEMLDKTTARNNLSEQHFSSTAGLHTITDLPSKDVIIREDYNLSLQRSIVQLLQNACSKKISISRLRLIGSYRSVDLRGMSLHLQSYHSIPILPTLKELWIEEKNRTMTEKEIKALLHYSSKCLGLEKLWFHYCLLPQSIQDGLHLPVLRSRKMKVMWDPRHTIQPRYLLNLEDGRWEHRKTNFQMTGEDYAKEVQYAKCWNRGSKH